jgi:hypothetical protein
MSTSYTPLPPNASMASSGTAFVGIVRCQTDTSFREENPVQLISYLINAVDTPASDIRAIKSKRNGKGGT